MARPTQTEGNPKPGGPFVATVVSTVLWVLSIILAFMIKPGHALAFVPDALLLLGFFPLLILWRRGWVILLFGFFNAFIGFFLLLLEFLPDEKFTGAMQAMRQHLLSMHSCWTWMTVGVVALLWGSLSIAVTVTNWFLKKRKAN